MAESWTELHHLTFYRLFAKVELPMSKYITVDKNIMGGAPVIWGPHIPIERIMFLIKDGYNIDAIRCHTEFCVMVQSRKARKPGLDWL